MCGIKGEREARGEGGERNDQGCMRACAYGACACGAEGEGVGVVPAATMLEHCAYCIDLPTCTHGSVRENGHAGGKAGRGTDAQACEIGTC